MYDEDTRTTLTPMMSMGPGIPPRFRHKLTAFRAVNSMPDHASPYLHPIPGPSGLCRKSPSSTATCTTSSPDLAIPCGNGLCPGSAYSRYNMNSPENNSSSSSISPSMEVRNMDTASTSPASPLEAGRSSQKKGSAKNKERKQKGVPYIPSYMDLSNGPEPCVVCGDAATGYHYRCMTCEGCKGFFRRTIQKNLKYNCKWQGACVIDKTTRNQCQKCRYIKCLAVGMATDLVLNEKQRVAKRRLIEKNRERRKEEDQEKPKIANSKPVRETLTEKDIKIIHDVVTAFQNSGTKSSTNRVVYEGVRKIMEMGTEENPTAESLTPAIMRVINFAKGIPGFTELNTNDQMLLLKTTCMEVMCLRAANKFDPEDQVLLLLNGTRLHRSHVQEKRVAVYVDPIFDFAIGLSKLNIDYTEVALLGAILLSQSDRSGLVDPRKVDRVQENLLEAFRLYVTTNHPNKQPHLWAKILMKVIDLRTISTRHSERVLCTRLDHEGDIPQLLLDIFQEENIDDEDSPSNFTHGHTAQESLSE